MIPLREQVGVHLRRLFLISYLAVRYLVRKLVSTEMEQPGDIVRIYVRDYEAQRTLRKLGIAERDATAAIKAATYMHNLTHPLGEITEMSPRRSVRVEKHCPFSGLFPRDTCKNLISGPAFQGLCEAINPELIHTHTKYLSGGDDQCDLTFELSDNRVNAR